ncbi:MAG: hypothetical protein AAF490_32200 [Chloroflexota bacterium]
MAFPITAFALSMRGEINFGQNPQRHLRLFMVQEEDASGVGIEWARTSRNRDCAITSINYLMWDGEGEPTSFCQCYDPTTGEPSSATLGRCSR